MQEHILYAYSMQSIQVLYQITICRKHAYTVHGACMQGRSLYHAWNTPIPHIEYARNMHLYHAWNMHMPCIKQCHAYSMHEIIGTHPCMHVPYKRPKSLHVSYMKWQTLQYCYWKFHA